MSIRVVRLLIAAGAAIVVAACTPGGGSIYWTLENEVKVEDLSLPNEITVFDVTKIGTSYYAAAGKIWTVEQSVLDAAGGQWDVDATIAPPQSGDLCTALVASPFGTGTLFGGFVNSSGNRGLFESTAAPSFAGQTAATLPVAGSQIALLKVVNNGSDRLVVVTAWLTTIDEVDVYVFDIVYSASAGSYAAASFDVTRTDGDRQKPINDIIWSTVPAIDAWFATEGTKLYTNPNADMSGNFTLATMAGITAGEELTGLFDDGTNLYVASRAGAVYYSPDGTSWTRIAAPTISGAHPPLTRFAGPIYSGILLVGSEEFGYYRLDTSILASTDPFPLTRFPTTTIGLHAATVTKFLFDAIPDPDRVFAGTAMGGLWRGKVSAADGSIDWNQE